jgi:hypothetical protein
MSTDGQIAAKMLVEPLGGIEHEAGGCCSDEVDRASSGLTAVGASVLPADVYLPLCSNCE